MKEKNPDDFVEVTDLDPTILIELPYATADNLTGKQLYRIEKCFLRREVAENLVRAHQSLAERNLGLKVWDGYRPHHVQYEMFKVLPVPGMVSDPAKGSNHNRGAAVDVTLVELGTGREVVMPTGFDTFGERAHSAFQDLPAKILENRTLLQKTMLAHGFTTIVMEWWHFCFKDAAKFDVVDLSFEDLVELAG